MFPQSDKRSEMYEYPTEELSFVALLERRRNHMRDLLMRRVTELTDLIKTRIENPTSVTEMKNVESNKVEHVSITQQVAEHREIVASLRKQCDTLDEMIAAAKEGDAVFREKFFSDEILFADLIDEAMLDRYYVEQF